MHTTMAQIYLLNHVFKTIKQNRL